MSSSGVESMISWNSVHSSLLPIPGKTWRRHDKMTFQPQLAINISTFVVVLRTAPKPGREHRWSHDRRRYRFKLRWHLLTDADIPGLLANLHLHIPAEPLGTFPAVPGPHRIKLGVREKALVDGGDSGRGDGGGGCVGLAPRAAGCGRHWVGFWSVLLHVQRWHEARTWEPETKALCERQTVEEGSESNFLLLAPDCLFISAGKMIPGYDLIYIKTSQLQFL